MQRSKVSKIARELRIILDRGIDREWGQDPFTAAAFHVCNLQPYFTVEKKGSELVIKHKDKVVAAVIWCDLGVSFDNYYHNHELLYHFLTITLKTVKELAHILPLQEH
tara:strand:- start:2378 stop:2701 length:324 start_codon:yes stop_codon:yes gene_type:complete